MVLSSAALDGVSSQNQLNAFGALLDNVRSVFVMVLV
jgi:hypothetical protein